MSGPGVSSVTLSTALIAAFDAHTGNLSEKRKRGQEGVAGKSALSHSYPNQYVWYYTRWSLCSGLVETFKIVDETEGCEQTEEIGTPRSSDVFNGDRRMRTLRTLLELIDDRGFERSSQQMEFHDNFINTCGRILCGCYTCSPTQTPRLFIATH